MLFVASCLSCDVCCLLFVVCCALFVVCCMLLIACRLSLLAATCCCVSLLAHGFLFVVVVCGVPRNDCGLLFVVS